MAHLDLLRDWFRRVWIAGDVDAIGDYFAPGTEATGILPGAGLGPQDFAEFVPALRQHLRNPEIVFLRQMETADCAWALVEVRAQAALDLTPIRFEGQAMIRLEAGRIVEAHNHFDLVTLFETLGLLPPDTIALCLAGERIG